jgi:hypothetical protein
VLRDAYLVHLVDPVGETRPARVLGSQRHVAEATTMRGMTQHVEPLAAGPRVCVGSTGATRRTHSGRADAQ